MENYVTISSTENVLFANSTTTIFTPYYRVFLLPVMYDGGREVQGIARDLCIFVGPIRLSYCCHDERQHFRTPHRVPELVFGEGDGRVLHNFYCFITENAPFYLTISSSCMN